MHAEAGPHLDRSLQLIRSLGKKAGVSLTPHTPESAIAYVLDRLDLILVMTVNPGFGGQAFIPAMTDKIARIRAMIGARPIHLEVDGGVTPETAGACAKAGADVLVAGSATFKGGKYKENMDAIRAAAAKGQRRSELARQRDDADIRDEALRRHDADQMSAYIAPAFQHGPERRVKMIVIVRTSPHRAVTEPLS